MIEIIKIPKLGLTMEFGILTQWLVEEGDVVEKGDTLFTLETDKIANDIEAPVEGTILKLLVNEGDEVPINAPVCYIGDEGEAPGTEPSSKVDELQVKERKTQSSTNGTNTVEDIKVKEGTERLLISPIAKRIGEENGLDLSLIIGSGPNNRITKMDILEAVSAQKASIQDELASNDFKQYDLDESTPAPSGLIGQPKSLEGLRKVIARRMTESKQQIPHVYFKTTIDAGCLVAKRSELNKKVSYNDLIIKAIAITIAEHPQFNSFIKGEKLYQRNEINIGLAVSVPKGLFVPVVKNANKPLKRISADTTNLISKVRSNTILLDEQDGGSMTLSNLGAYNIDEFYAIINPGESALLAVGQIQEKVFVSEGKIDIRPGMAINLSVDHRIIDGTLAAQFLGFLKNELETNIMDYN